MVSHSQPGASVEAFKFAFRLSGMLRAHVAATGIPMAVPSVNQVCTGGMTVHLCFCLSLLPSRKVT